MKWILILVSTFAVLTPGGTVEDFEAVDIEGRSWSLDSLLGRNLTVFSFWSTSCSPCNQVLDLLDSLYREYADSGISVISVNTDTENTLPEVEPTVKERGWDFTVIMDTGGELMKIFNVGPLPHTFYVDNEKKIRESFIGYTSSDAPAVCGIITAAVAGN